MSKRALTMLGLVLIGVGLISLIYQGITYKTREKVIDVGSFHATVETEKTIPLPPLLGALSLAGGIVLVIVGAKRAG
jgi:hypothetical protein